MKSSLAETQGTDLTSYGKRLSLWVSNYMDKVPKNVEAAVKGDQLNVIASKAPNELNAALTVVVSDVLSLTGRNVSPQMIAFIGKTIQSRFYYFRLNELVMVLQKGVQGHYGNVPSGANPIVFWCEQYDNGERLEYHQAEALKHKEAYEKQKQEEIKEDARREVGMLKDQIQKQRIMKTAKAVVESQNTVQK